MNESADGEEEAGSENITITRRHDISLSYKLISSIMRLLRPHLATPPKNKYPPGSPRLRKHPKHIKTTRIIEREITVPLHPLPDSDPGSNVANKSASLWVYEFHPPKRASHGSKPRPGPAHTIFYFCGGGFQAPALAEHWKLCAHLAAHLPRARVVLVSYPLAPHSPAKDALPLLRAWLARALEEQHEHGAVSLAGDSAGANIALSLALWCADQLAGIGTERSAGGSAAKAEHFRKLRSVLAISPPTDFRNTNPAIARADAQDPVLGKRVADRAAAVWTAGGGDAADPYLSANLADLASVRAAGLRVDGVVGTADVLAPDELVFVERCRRAGVKGKWLVWEGQMHVFPLTACYGLREAREARSWVVDVLREITAAGA
ncbi:Alpha/Beta hydrolase protein [Hypoxylon fuscum]|nr:Alpha/Beta hydrolase protein [Hypoxylon fuscum]